MRKVLFFTVALAAVFATQSLETRQFYLRYPKGYSPVVYFHQAKLTHKTDEGKAAIGDKVSDGKGGTSSHYRSIVTVPDIKIGDKVGCRIIENSLAPVGHIGFFDRSFPRILDT